MSYQVLARKWRPRSFDAVVGQGHVLQALTNALERGRLHHAFLFTGTRGVGKTTIARILAKALNCESGETASPCGTCGSCVEIDEGRFVDLIEVDAASRTKVEDTRELLENVQYAPTRGRYKVYLIDEVHMLSNHSFNALLKTLEEPPPHVKFLLATTDPQRLPVTVLSRCLQFNLKRLPAGRIREHLAHILDQEGIAYETGGLQLVAEGADGSVRDALSLLDQAIAFGGGRVAEAEVRDMLGTVSRGEVVALVEALADEDAQALLAAVQALEERAADFAGVLAELLSLLHRIAVAQAVPGAGDDEAGDGEAVARLAGRLGAADVQLYYQIGLLGRRDLAQAPDPRCGFEMVMLRMLAFRPSDAQPQPQARSQAAGAAAPRQPAGGGAPAPAAGARQARSAPPAPAAAQAADEWSSLVARLGLTGMVRELALNCALRSAAPERVELVLSGAAAKLHSKRMEQRIEQALREHFGVETELVLAIGDAEPATPAAVQQQRQAVKAQSAQEAVDRDANIRAIKEAFNARIVPDSIQPLE